MLTSGSGGVDLGHARTPSFSLASGESTASLRPFDPGATPTRRIRALRC
jgi:hypothetical protein